MVRIVKSADADALDQIPGGVFVLTSQYENRRDAVMVKWVQQCSESPAMLMVALPKGLPIEVLIHGSQSFALCQISADDRFLLRKFAQPTNGNDDPLVTILTRTAPSGSPILDRAMTCLDCEIVRRVELDSDFRVYVGQVIFSAVLNRGAPAICFGGNGFGNGG